MSKFLKNHWFLLSLVAVLATGFLFGETLQVVTEMQILRNSVLFAVLFVMALSVSTKDLARAFLAPWAALYATAINFVLIPVLAWFSSNLFDVFLGQGLIIAAAVPCTLASAAVWTRRAGGNDSVAIFVTLITNLLCFALTPFWLWVTTGDAKSIAVWDLVLKLALLVVLPMVLAQIVRNIGGIGEWATRKKTPLGVSAQIGILTMVLIGAAKMGIKVAGGDFQFRFTDVLMVLLVVNAIHFLALFFGYYSARWLGFVKKDQIAIGIAGSQKTLMVGLNTAVELDRSILPMLLFHICQLIFDTLIADRWRKQLEAEAEDTSDVVP